MVVVTIVIAVLLVIALVYIVALLRSHADILRRLAALEERAGSLPAALTPTPGPEPEPAGPVGGGEVITARPISGTTLPGDSVTLSFGAGSPVTLLAFLTSGCTSCAPLWAGLHEARDLAPLAERVAVITHDAMRESPTRLERLAPPGTEVIMSSAAWADYAVPGSPHFVLTDGRGGILGRGSALSLSALQTMVADAQADVRRAADTAVTPADTARTTAGAEWTTAGAARTTAERAQRSESALASAGIGPGHPSLYPGASGLPHEQDR
ncbi:MAG: hypothetical protein ACRDPM_17630 [Solirubrobacteraceae bacterium]